MTLSSEELLLALFDQAPVFMCVYEGPELRLSRMNRCLRNAHGPCAIGKTAPELWGADAPVVGILQRVFASGEPETIRHAPSLLSGSEYVNRYFTRTFMPLKSDDGRVHGILVVAYDVTDEVRARIEREESQAELQRLFALLDEAPVMLAALEPPDWRLTMANRSLREMLGNHIAVGMTIRDLLAAGRGTLAVIERVYTTGRSETYDTIAQLAPFTGRAFSMSFVPMRGPDGKITGVMAAGIEVTEQRRARETLEAQARDLEAARRDAVEAGRAKDQFLAMLGHELRNPLQPMLTAVQVMRLDGTMSPALDMLEREVQYLTSLVDDLLDISRISRGMVALKRQPLELATVVNRALEMSSPLLEQRDHHVHSDLGPPSLGVSADPQRLAQAIANLIQNAAKYSDPGSEIRIEVRRENDRAVLRVSDEGVGIAQDMLDRVFEAFVQQPQTLARSSGGLGLGLAIVKNLVEAHGGSVSAHSEGPGRGSTFAIELPAIEVRVGPHMTAARSRPPNPAVTPARILVVDDNFEAADILQIALGALGHEILVAYDAPSALELAQAHVPQVALVDIGLPVMDGYQLGELLRAAYRIPIVAITGYGQVTDRERSRAAGFAAHLVKPVDLGELAELVGKLVGGTT